MNSYFLALILITLIPVVALTGQRLVWRRYGVGKTLVSTVETFRLTFTKQGQQILTMDGRNYNVWLNFVDFYKVGRGNVITHRPYFRNGMLSTEILDVQYKKKNNAASTQSPRKVSS